MLPDTTALLIIDVQKGLDDPSHGERSNPDAEGNMARILAAWRRSGRPLIHVQHHSNERDSLLRPESPGCEIKDEVAPVQGEPVVHKSTNSAFQGTNLEERLSTDGIDTLVLVGLTTDHCVSATARTAGDLGFTAYVVSDATAAHEKRDHRGIHWDADVVHGVSLATLHGEFATVVDTEEVLASVGGGA